MPKQRRSFSPEFKQQAASLVLDQGYNFSEASRSVGVGETVLRRWVRQLQMERQGVTPQDKAITPDQRKRLSLAVSPFVRVWGMMVWWSPCRSREIVSAIGDRGHDPSKSIQIYPVDGVGGMAGFNLSATFQGSKSSMRAIL